MTIQENSQERTQLHQWIDRLPPRQFNIIYTLVEELLESEQDETEYLLSSEKMKERLLVARRSGVGMPIEEVREKLGI